MSVAEDNNGPLTRLREAADKNEGTSKLADAVRGYLTAKATSVASGAAEKLGSYTEQLTGDGPGAAAGGLLKRGLAEGARPASAGGKAAKDKIKGLFGGRGGGGGGGPKVVNIIENIDVGVPLRVAYNQWTRFPDFGSFAKGVRSAGKTGETTSNWTAKIFWSTRSWKATITEQIQDYRIAWTSEGAKGTTKGVVTFHPLGDNLTRVLLVVQYYPKGFFEQTANLWRAQGRRLRLDLKHYRRQVMMMTQAEAEELEGWRGEIRESDVLLDHEDALALEEAGLTDEEWAELEELDEDELAALDELDEDERAELAGAGEEEEEFPEDEYAEEEEEGEEEYDEEEEEPEEEEHAAARR